VKKEALKAFKILKRYDMEQTTAKKTIAQLREDIGEIRARISRNGYTVKEVEEALEHHHEQLKRLGATLEDDICGLLRRMKELAEAQKRLEELTAEYELRVMRGEGQDAPRDNEMTK